jgi:hypothetical protein
MPNPRKLELQDIRLRANELRRRADELAGDIAYLRDYDAAVDLAHAERTGKPMKPETRYLPEDEERALEIMKMLPRSGA